MKENLTVASAIKLLGNLNISQLRGNTIDQVARKIAETGDNLFKTTPDNLWPKSEDSRKLRIWKPKITSCTRWEYKQEEHNR